MSAAADVIWQLAGERATSPLTFSDVAEPARAWVLAWLRTPKDGCEHADGRVLYTCAGARRAMCAPCAAAYGLAELVTHCGRCGALTGGESDPGSLSAVYAIGPDLIAAIVMCSRCLTTSTTERNEQ